MTFNSARRLYIISVLEPIHVSPTVKRPKTDTLSSDVHIPFRPKKLVDVDIMVFNFNMAKATSRSSAQVKLGTSS